MIGRDCCRWGAVSQRGQSALLGFVLLVGMVAAVSVGVLLVAGETITGAEQQAETERVEQAFVEMSQQLSSTAMNSDITQSMDIEAGENGAMVLKDTGKIHIYGSSFDENISIGAIEYEGENGDRIAYQAGGVFRETMDQTRVVSAPPVHFEDQTLTFPVVELDDEGVLDSGSMQLDHDGTTLISDSDVIENDVVTINITSQYYKGWEDYFERQAGENAITESAAINETHGYVTVKLGYTGIEAVFENTVVSDEKPAEPNNPNAGIHGNKMYGDEVDIDPIDSEIESMVKNAETEYDELPTDSQQITAGKYYVGDSFDTTSYDVNEFDVSNGNITVVVDGNLEIYDEIRVDGWEETAGEVQFYTNGSFDLNADMYVGESAYSPGAGQGSEPDESNLHARYLQVYGTSDFEMQLGGNDHYEGIIYAPGGTVKSDGGGGTADIYGSVVTGTVDISGGNSEIWHDSDLTDFEPRMENGGQLPPQITYLNVVKHNVAVDS
ncbi:DUF7289 family protein [Natrialba chahannaoensis]|nr:hypothetical protein [Natrialba chahannaoensis]